MATGSSQAASLGRVFGEDDLADLCEALYRVSTKYVFFGLRVGLQISEIRDIEANNRNTANCLLEVLSMRLKKNPALTCTDIVNALESQSLGEQQLAEEFRKKFEYPSDNKKSCPIVFSSKRLSDSTPLKYEVEQQSDIGCSSNGQDDQYGKIISKKKLSVPTTAVDSYSPSVLEKKQASVENRKRESGSKECDKAEYQDEMKQLVSIFEHFLPNSAV